MCHSDVESPGRTNRKTEGLLLYLPPPHHYPHFLPVLSALVVQLCQHSSAVPGTLAQIPNQPGGTWTHFRHFLGKLSDILTFPRRSPTGSWVRLNRPRQCLTLENGFQYLEERERKHGIQKPLQDKVICFSLCERHNLRRRNRDAQTRVPRKITHSYKALNSRIPA